MKVWREEVRGVGGWGGRVRGRRGRRRDLIFDRGAGERRQKWRRWGREE